MAGKDVLRAPKGGHFGAFPQHADSGKYLNCRNPSAQTGAAQSLPTRSFPRVHLMNLSLVLGSNSGGTSRRLPPSAQFCASLSAIPAWAAVHDPNWCLPRCYWLQGMGKTTVGGGLRHGFAVLTAQVESCTRESIGRREPEGALLKRWQFEGT